MPKKRWISITDRRKQIREMGERHRTTMKRKTNASRVRSHAVFAGLALAIALVGASTAFTALAVPSKELFADITQEAGITWRHFSGQSPDRFLIETMGGGVAFLDFDHDGLQDIFFLNGGETPNGKSPVPVRNALYRNLGNRKFEEVAAKAGVDRLDFYGMGVAVGDFDNDGHPDLFITG